MNKVVTLDHFSKILTDFQKKVLDEKSLYQNFDDLLANYHFASQQSLEDLRKLVSAFDLPETVNKILLGKLVDTETTKIVKHPPRSPVVTDHDLTHSSKSHSSSLFNHLLLWQKVDREKEIAPGQIIRDTYRLERKIGQGGMGEVWKAVDLIQDAGDSRDKYVAIKFINHEIRSHPFALKALVREFARYKKLIHRNIVKAYEINRDENEIFLVMEFLEGMSLKDFIKQHPNGISLNEAKPIIGGMCKALNYAHLEGIVHLDFKPGNVFYDPETKIAKVIDFGIARLSKQSDRDKTLFDPGKLGAITTAYASIEMLIQEAPDPRDDIYGLACVTYELLSGKHPFNNGLAIVAERENMHPKPIKGLTEDEFNAIKHGLCFDKNNRTPNAEQFFQELYKPGVIAKRQKVRRLVAAAIIAVILFATPFIGYHAYKSWQLHTVSSAIQQQKESAIEDFKALSDEDQSTLLKNDKIRLALLQFPLSNKSKKLDAIQFLQQFSTNTQKFLFKQRDVRTFLIPYYVQKVRQEMAEDNFIAAKNDINRILSIYPDSRSLTDLAESVGPSKRNRLFALKQQYQQCLTNSSSLLTLKPCLTTTVDKLKKISQQPPLSKDSRLARRYESEVSQAITQNDLVTAQRLLTDWRQLIPENSPQRKNLETKLRLNQEASKIIQLLLSAKTTEMPTLLHSLLTLEPSIKTKILQTSTIKDKLRSYFNNTIDNQIRHDDFSAGFKLIDTGMRLFSNSQKEKHLLKKLKARLSVQRTQRLKQLRTKYNAILKNKEPDVALLQSIVNTIGTIKPDDALLQFPHAANAFANKIDSAIKHEQFDLAERLLNNWFKLLPNDQNSQRYQQLSTRRIQRQQAWQRRKLFSDKILQALQSSQAAVLKNSLQQMQTTLSAADSRLVIAKLKKPLQQFYRQQVDEALQDDNFSAAIKINADLKTLFPKDPVVRNGRRHIAQFKASRLKQLATDYQKALKKKPLSAQSAFTHLDKIRKIDASYLTKHPQLFKQLKTRLVSLARDPRSLPQLQNAILRWEAFLNGDSHLIKARETLKQTKNLISLRCLYNGRKLKQQNQQQQGNELLMFGLSLDPINTVKNALESELQK